MRRNRNDRTFLYTSIIRECYIEVLSREPDPSGLNTYMNRLKRGWNKFDIKNDLFNSPEGQMKLWNNRQVESKPKLEYESEKEEESEQEEESEKTDKLSDLEYFNYLQELITLQWDKYNEGLLKKIYSNFKINKGFFDTNNQSTNFLYCIKRNTYNHFYIEDTNQSNIVQIFINSNNQTKKYFKINNINLTNTMVSDYNGSSMQERNLVHNKSSATYFEKVICEESNKYYLIVKNGKDIDKTLLDIPETEKDGICKFLVIDLKSNICKLVNNNIFYSDTTNFVKYWMQ